MSNSYTTTAPAVPAVDPVFTGTVALGPGKVTAPALAAAADRDTGLFFPAGDTLAVATAGAERLRVEPTGMVRLGGSTGAESLRVVPLAGATVCLVATGGLTGNSPSLGSSSGNLGLAPAAGLVMNTNTGSNGCGFAGQASGIHLFSLTRDAGNGARLASYDGVRVVTGAMSGATSGTEQLRIVNTPNAVNSVQVTGASTGNAPAFAVQGTDADIGLKLLPKGGGHLWFGTYSAGAPAATGSIAIRDSGGTIRQLLCA
ncbi:hypothetical protein ABNQ39_35590 (plasmid) [Azospirillum sp. A26]|uniref:hypothetical protein n=1 Tax=Azospirillum sp. A26 TaxID=3160607 RepID=UPI00366C868E